MAQAYRKIGAIRRALLRGLKRKKHLVDLCAELGILDAKGKPNPGLAHNIAHGRHGKPYEPMELDVRNRLGLKPICPSCKRPLLDPDRPKPMPKEYEVYELFWRKLSPSQRKAVMRYVYDGFMSSTKIREILNTKE